VVVNRWGNLGEVRVALMYRNDVVISWHLLTFFFVYTSQRNTQL
jgi:hypothetical protein